MVEDMLTQGVVEESQSPWASPIVLVKKKDGDLRFCVDYRQLNRVTKQDVYPLPRIDDTLDLLSGSKFFTTLDLASGYWQVAMDPESEKTAFVTWSGLYPVLQDAVRSGERASHLSEADGNHTSRFSERRMLFGVPG